MTQANVPREYSDAEHIHVLGATLSITADSETTNGEYFVLDMLIPPMFENGLHTHDPSEVFHVIEGDIRLHVDGEDRILSPGMTGYVSGDAIHGFANAGDEESRVIAVMSPGGAEGFFRDVGHPSVDRSLPEPIEPTEEMLQSVFATGEKYGFEFLGPLPEQAE